MLKVRFQAYSGKVAVRPRAVLDLPQWIGGDAVDIGTRTFTLPMPALTTGLRWLRRTWRGLIVAGVAVLLNGCVSLAAGASADALYSAAFRIKVEDASKLKPHQLESARSILLFASSQGLEALDKGPVAGLACKLSVAPLIPKFFWYPPLSDDLAPTPEDAARLQLKIKTVLAGGNAIIEPVCNHHGGVDWANNCFDSWVCKGRAVWIP